MWRTNTSRVWARAKKRALVAWGSAQILLCGSRQGTAPVVRALDLSNAQSTRQQDTDLPYLTNSGAWVIIVGQVA